MTTENNKLIAEFMGGQKVLPNNDVYNMPTHNNLCYGIEEMQYHTSWDWLMPVISRCLEIGANVSVERIYHSLHTQDLSFAYESTVEFIKEYNN